MRDAYYRDRRTQLSKMAPSIEAVGLTKSYGEFTAVSQLNLKVDGRKCVGFLGPNGAGKTTTFRILSGLLAPSSGSAQPARDREFA